MNRQKKQGVQLGEAVAILLCLLAVAAIVVPVLAQAGADAANNAVCFSNLQRWSKALNLYAQDYSDRIVASYENNKNHLHDDGSVYRDYVSWPFILQPYIRSAHNANCPDQWYNTFVQSERSRELLYAGYGLNYGYLGTYLGRDPNGGSWVIWQAILRSQVNRPEHTVMVVDTVGVNYADAAHDSVWVPTNALVDPPDANYAVGKSFYGVGWGEWCSGDITQYFDYPGYGGLSPRHNGGMYVTGQVPNGTANTLFVDGHVKTLSVPALAAGTNYSPTVCADKTQVTNPTAYLWNPNY